MKVGLKEPLKHFEYSTHMSISTILRLENLSCKDVCDEDNAVNSARGIAMGARIGASRRIRSFSIQEEASVRN